MENVQVPSTISITQIKQSSVTLCVTEYTNGKNFLTHQTKYKYIQTESPWTITQNSICSLAATGVQFNITEINVNEKEIYPAQIIKGSSLQSPKMYHPIKNKPTWFRTWPSPLPILKGPRIIKWIISFNITTSNLSQLNSTCMQ